MFPLHKVKDPNSPTENHNWFVDGGLWANNPVMVALVEALSFAPEGSPIELVSVSTCPPFKAPPVREEESDRGILAWKAGIGMLEMGLDAQSQAYDYMAKALTDHIGGGVSYIRLSDPLVDENIARDLTLDNPSERAISALVSLASRAVDQNISEATTGDQTKRLILQVFSDIAAVENSII
ncbi:hypothetical protein GCM10007053_10200 [Halioglobus pacificus]|uniref:PNPLA domain-containing protein n=2 Tax=Parahalioglobus pacificus TaxID=930806 RepID=A0A919CIR7_9GAMM|nr:hypothetical protein GCM10007053_10200 [Halioglobus pacificus]